MTYQLENMDIYQIAKGIREKKFNCLEVTDYFLKRIDESDEFNAFVYVAHEQARQHARTLDQELEFGHDRGLLHGIPIAIKDLFHVKGMRTTAGAGYLRSSVEQEDDAAFVEKLKTAGVNIIGKNNMAELAVGFTSRNTSFGDINNPIKPNYTAGGSSGGTAAAVTAGLCVAGIGSDTGGSIRLPASVCGLVGIRPTRGLVDLHGGISRANTLDTAGPMAKNLSDALILLRAMYGLATPFDLIKRGNGFAGDINLSELSIALPNLSFLQKVDEDIRDIFSNLDELLQKNKIKVKEAPLSLFEKIDESGVAINLLRYEFNIHMQELFNGEIPTQVFAPSVYEDIEHGSQISNFEYAECLLKRAKLINEFSQLFKKVDAILLPIMGTGVPKIDASNDVFESARQFLMPASFLGMPAMSVPYGNDKNGMPVGVQIIGNHFHEEEIMKLAYVINGSNLL